MNPTMSPLVLLHPDDNILVCRCRLLAGVTLGIGETGLVAAVDIDLGHKVARCNLRIGDKVIKYGAPIGSMTADASPGEHIHLHNMRSDYISTYTRETKGEGE